MSKAETIEYGMAANAIDFAFMAACRAAGIRPNLEPVAKTNTSERLNTPSGLSFRRRSNSMAVDLPIRLTHDRGII